MGANDPELEMDPNDWLIEIYPNRGSREFGRNQYLTILHMSSTKSGGKIADIVDCTYIHTYVRNLVHS